MDETLFLVLSIKQIIEMMKGRGDIAPAEEGV